MYHPIAPELPPEVLSLIFDCIASNRDWATLRTISLLSHQYFRQARKLLFASVTLRLRCNPSPISIRDVARRIQGLCDMLQRDPEAHQLVKTLIVLDSYPVYDSQWITQQINLPRLLDLLVSVRSFTFGCEVGYLQWPLFSFRLRASLQKLFRLPQLRTLHLCNLGSIPPPVLMTSVRYLYLNNITTMPLHPLLAGSDPPPVPLDFEDINLSYINIRTVSLDNTESAWGVILEHRINLKFIQWRCWEGKFCHPVFALFVDFNNNMMPSPRSTSPGWDKLPRYRGPRAIALTQETLHPNVLWQGRTGPARSLRHVRSCLQSQRAQNPRNIHPIPSPIRPRPHVWHTQSRILVANCDFAA